VFLAEMERVVPWSALGALIEPFCPKPGNGRPAGRRRADAAHLFLAALVQSVGPGGGGALYYSAAMRRFAGINLGREPVHDETTVCRFRHLLEAHDLGRQLFDEVQRQSHEVVKLVARSGDRLYPLCGGGLGRGRDRVFEGRQGRFDRLAR
jgi:IS5 family transposase